VKVNPPQLPELLRLSLDIRICTHGNAKRILKDWTSTSEKQEELHNPLLREEPRI
jgi:hypothetical protein